MTTYVFDTSAIADIFERYYPIDVFPSVQQFIVLLASQRRLIVPRDVRDELGAPLQRVVGWFGCRTRVRGGDRCVAEDRDGDVGKRMGMVHSGSFGQRPTFNNITLFQSLSVQKCTNLPTTLVDLLWGYSTR